jgi:hypothetical protein
MMGLSVVRALALAAVSSTVVLTGAQRIPARADYVIVGGGPAGLVLAEQLSRDKRTQVVLLEAGPDGIKSELVNSNSPCPSGTKYLSIPSPC